jgi:LacI family transcriptional regulator
MTKMLHSVTLQDVALKCGVNKSTVSRALRRSPSLNPATVERIIAIADEMGYNAEFHDMARRLALRKQGKRALNHVIGLLFPVYPQAEYYSQMLRGIMSTLMEQGFGLLTVGVNREDMPCPEKFIFPPSFHRGDVDGVLTIVRPDHLCPLLENLTNNTGFGQRPVVSLIWTLPGHPSVLTDDEQGVYSAVSHLLDLGHSHLLLLQHYPLGGDTESRRLAGARRAVLERGLDPEKHLLRIEHTYAWLDPVKIAEMTANGSSANHPLAHFLGEHPEVTAILTQNDAGAIGAWYLLRAAGLRVPDDISLIGYDDLDPLLDEQGRNILTSVRLPLSELGREAARQIVAQVTGEAGCTEPIVLPTTLVVRGSTAPCNPARRVRD